MSTDRGDDSRSRDALDCDTRYQALLRGVLDPLVVIDHMGIVQSASDSVERVFGYPPSELVGQNISVLVSEPHGTLHDDYLARYLKTGESGILGLTRQFDVVKKGGALIPCELSVSRVDIPGEPGPLFTGSFRDVSESVRSAAALRESERRLRAVFDQGFQFVGLLDTDGRVLQINRSALDVAGIESADVIGSYFWETYWWQYSDDAPDRVRESVAAAAAGEFIRYEIEFMDRDKVLRTVDFSLKGIREEDDSIGLLIAEGRDITDIKRARESQDQMMRALAEIGESAAMLAHEIRTPVTAVNLALRAVADRLGTDAQETLGDLAQRMERLEQTMSQTLAFAKNIELHQTGCNTHELFNSSILHARAELVVEGVDARISGTSQELLFSCDCGLLEEVLVNLLHNAAHALGVGGKIELSSLATSPGFVDLYVDDDGPGIPDAIVATLFKPFVTTREAGTGLGLPICRRIIGEHGGTITAERSPLGGAQFHIRLPRGARQ